jgi:hypothetical protein
MPLSQPGGWLAHWEEVVLVWMWELVYKAWTRRKVGVVGVRMERREGDGWGTQVLKCLDHSYTIHPPSKLSLESLKKEEAE